MHYHQKVEEERRKGREVLDLTVGEPDFPTPEFISEAAFRAMKAGKTHYTPPQGIPELREAVAESETKRKGYPVRPDQVIISPGAKPILFYTMLALVNPGDLVVVPDPGYPVYRYLALLVDARVLPLRLRPERGFRPAPEDLERALALNPTLLVINSPSNPTGTVWTAEDFGMLAEMLRDRTTYLLSDEIYGRIVFDGLEQAPSPAAHEALRERTIVVDGFSKAFAMTGWRLGYGVVPQELLGAFRRIQSNIVTCAPSFAQWAALEALERGEGAVQAMVEAYERRRNLGWELLNESKERLSLVRPQGAFYFFPRVTDGDAEVFADFLLKRYGVGVTPGESFGHGGGGHVRVSFATDEEVLKEGLHRLIWALEEFHDEGRGAHPGA